MEEKSIMLTCTRGDKFIIAPSSSGTAFDFYIQDRSTGKPVNVHMIFRVDLALKMADFILQNANRKELIVYGFNQIIAQKGKKK